MMGVGLLWVGAAFAQNAEPRFTGNRLIQDVGDAPLWDDTSTDLYFANNRVRDARRETYAWSPSLTGRVLNGQNGDTLVVTVKKGRRTLGSHRCQLTQRCDQRALLQGERTVRCGRNGSYDGIIPYAEVANCRMDDIAVQDDGTFAFELAYEDANTGTTTPLRTLDVPVIAHAHMTNMSERRHAEHYVPMPRDMVGSSWMEYDLSSFGRTVTAVEGTDTFRQFDYFSGVPSIHFWALNGESSSSVGDAALRCQVDGAPIRLNQAQVHLRRNDGQQGEDWRTRNGRDATREKWGYNHYQVRIPWRVLVKENERPLVVAPGQHQSEGGIQPGSTERSYDLSSAPGSYECSLVIGGNEVRTFSFQVDESGIALHAEQQGPDGIHAAFGRFFIETGIPAGTALDAVFDQRAARASGFFGRPWGPSVARAIAAFPRSTRAQAPAAVRR